MLEGLGVWMCVVNPLVADKGDEHPRRPLDQEARPPKLLRTGSGK